VKKQERRE